jgi:hypothetical protein
MGRTLNNKKKQSSHNYRRTMGERFHVGLQIGKSLERVELFEDDAKLLKLKWVGVQMFLLQLVARRDDFVGDCLQPLIIGQILVDL